MTKSQRVHYHQVLWPATCEAKGWDPRDEQRRRDTTRYVLSEGGDKSGRDSTKNLAQHEITGLFLFLAHLADPASMDKLLEWENWKRDPLKYNKLRQARWWEKKAGYRNGGRLERERFRGHIPTDPLEAAPTSKEVDDLLMTARERARAKQRRERQAAAEAEPVHADLDSNEPF